MNALPSILFEDLVRASLLEDLGRAGDITTDAIVPHEARVEASFVVRQPGVIAGLDVAACSFTSVDRNLVFTQLLEDGTRVKPGDVIATVYGSARGVLTGERVALNFLGHLGGIATVTREISDAIAHTKARLCCTRKTTPLLRALEKYAVRCGGGLNHRFGLDDAILIKDNHIAIAGSITAALTAAKTNLGHLVKIEIEVDTLEQLDEVLLHGADVVLLDNMSPDMLREAVKRVNGRAITEASGRITPSTAKAVAETGVDLISAGWITHSAPVLDIGLDF